MELNNRIVAELNFWSKRRNYHFSKSCSCFAFKYNFSSDKRTTNHISCLKLTDQWTTLIRITGKRKRRVGVGDEEGMKWRRGGGE